MSQKEYSATVKPEINEKNTSKTIQSVEISARILNVLGSSSAPMALKDIASAALMSRSQAHRYLASFVNTGLVERTGSLGYYDLGPLALRLGLSAIAKLDVTKIASRCLEKLVIDTNLTGLICIWGPSGPTIINWTDGRPAISSSLGLGSVLSVFSSTAGQVFLATLPPNLTEKVYEEELRMFPAKATIDIEKLKSKVIKQGYAVAHNTVVRGLSSVSVPVFNMQGVPDLVVVMISDDPSDFRIKSWKLKHIIKAVKQASIENGYYQDSKPHS